jgi:hypothetical protein
MSVSVAENYLDPITKAMKTLLETYVPDFEPVERAWVSPGLSIETDVLEPNVNRVILGRKSYADMLFPSVYIDFKTIEWETSGFKSEIVKFRFRIIVVTKEEPSHWSGVLKAADIIALTRSALYNTIGTHNTRTLLGTCNDCFDENAQIDTEPLGNAPDAVWSYFWFYARKKITA